MHAAPNYPVEAERFFEHFYDKNMTPEDKAYIAGFGFVIDFRRPQQNTCQVRIELSNPFATMSIGPYSRWGSDFATSVSARVGSVEYLILECRDIWKVQGGISIPDGQPIHLFVENPEWRPVADKLLRRYPRSP